MSKPIDIDRLHEAAKEGKYGPFKEHHEKGFETKEEFFASIVARLRSHLRLFNDENAEYPLAAMNLNYGNIHFENRQEVAYRAKELAEICGVGLSILIEEEDGMIIRQQLNIQEGKKNDDKK